MAFSESKIARLSRSCVNSSSLPGVERKSHFRAVNSVDDPFRKFALAEDEPTMLWWNRPWRGADEEGTLPHLKSLKKRSSIPKSLSILDPSSRRPALRSLSGISVASIAGPQKYSDKNMANAAETSMMSKKLPLWLRLFLLIGVVVFAAGAGLLGYRYYTRPVTLTVAVGSIDGEAANAMSTIAGELVSTNAPVRLKVIDSGNALEAANAFSAGKVDLAVVRGDVGDLSQAQAVVVVSHMVVLIIAPPGSSIDSMDNLKGRTVGVVGGAANAKIVDALTKEYDLARAKVAFKNLALTDVRQAVQSKQVSALLVTIPLAEKYLSLVRGFFQLDHKKVPVLIPIESAAAIAEAERAFESFEVPKGTLWGSPPVPEDDLTTLRTSLYLVAHKKLGKDLVTSLTQAIMSVRRNSSARAADFRTDHRAQHRPGCLPSTAPWSGSRLQQHHAELHG